jgi:hypothetical protein
MNEESDVHCSFEAELMLGRWLNDFVAILWPQEEAEGLSFTLAGFELSGD